MWVLYAWFCYVTIYSLVKQTRFDGRRYRRYFGGNLCRCTGYRPIVEAGLSLKNAKQPQWELDRNEILKKELLKIKSSEPVEITDGKNSFSVPTNYEDFSTTYADQPSSTIVSGATDIGLWVTKQNRNLSNMIWTGRVKNSAKSTSKRIL